MDAGSQTDDDVLDDADRCLLRDSALLSLSQPDAAGYLSRRAPLHGWYRHWFSLHGSQLNYYDVTPRGRGPLAGTISLFRNRTTVAATPKRPREIDLVDIAGKTHALRADSDAQLHWWIQVFAIARNKIPPAKPIATAPPPASTRSASSHSAEPAASTSAFGSGSEPSGTTGSGSGSGKASGRAPEASLLGSASAGGESTVDGSASARLSARAASSAAAADAFSSAAASVGGGAGVDGDLLGGAFSGSGASGKSGGGSGGSVPAATAPPIAKTASLPSTAVDGHLPVDHVLCVVHGIGVSDNILADNVKQLQESYADIAAKIFPDLNFRVEILVVKWRSALTNLDVHRKLQACVPIPPNPAGETNPLRQFMVHRIIDYVYYTHSRYRNNIMREITKQLNDSMADFRRRRPDFQGHISIFAHSLGAALCYDLLVRRARDDQSLLSAEGMRLDFQAANLFLAGSPLGTFLHLDPSLALGTNVSTLPFRVYNMFHPHDPIATRLEPFIEERFVGVRPIVVPYWINLGIRSSTAEWLGNLWGGSSTKKGWAGGAAKTPSSAGAAPANANGSEKADASSHAKAFSEINGGISGTSRAERGALGGMQSSSAKVGIGVGSEGAAALTASIQCSSTVDEGGIMGADGCPVRYFAEKAQQEIIAVTQLPKRLDFVLQLSSTMEEVSTSWSAFRAHTEYWANRDMMLLIMSSMIKTTHGIPDNVSRMPSIEVDSHLIDSRVHLKSTRFGCSWSNDLDGAHSGGDDQQWLKGNEHGSNDTQAVQGFEEGVTEFVDKIIEESAAMHDLILQHPNVRMRQGGITRSTSKSIGQASGGAGRGAGKGSATTPSYGGWASYIPWFGRDMMTRGASSDSTQERAAMAPPPSERKAPVDAQANGNGTDSPTAELPAADSQDESGARGLGAFQRTKRANSALN